MLFVKILAGFFLASIFLFLLMLFVKIKITVSARNKELVVRLGICFFQFTVYPFQHKRKQKERPKAEKKPENTNKKVEKKFHVENISAGEAVDLILDLLGDMENAFTIDTLLINFILATPDAARTGLLLGQISAAVGLILPYLDSHFIIRHQKISIDADFQSDRCRWDICFIGSTRPIRTLLVLAHNYKKIWNFIKKLRKAEGTQA